MLRALRILTGALILAAIAAPTSAQESFGVGQTVTANFGGADAACITQENLERYNSAREICQEGDHNECQVAAGLESQGVCGFHYGDYVVTAVQPQLSLMQISPTTDRSVSYWADIHDFH